MIVGAAVGTNEKDIDRVYKLLESKVDLIVVDTAHGHTKKVLTIIQHFLQEYLLLEIVFVKF